MGYRNLPASCDRRVNRVVGEQDEGSHPARRATQQRGCQPQRTDFEPTGRYYRFSRVVHGYRRESVTPGRDPGREGDLRRGGRRGGSKVPAKEGVAVWCKRIQRVGSGRGKARQ